MWPNPQFPVDLVKFTEEILNGKLHFLCSVTPLFDVMANFGSYHFLKDPLSGLRQFRTTESPLKLMTNALYFILTALFVLEIFAFLSWRFGFVEIQLDNKTKFMMS